MLKVSQTIYKHDVIVSSKINENAPKVTSTLWHCLIWQMHIQLYLLLETGSKPITGFVLATTYPSSCIKTAHLPKEKEKKNIYLRLIRHSVDIKSSQDMSQTPANADSAKFRERL